MLGVSPFSTVPFSSLWTKTVTQLLTASVTAVGILSQLQVIYRILIATVNNTINKLIQVNKLITSLTTSTITFIKNINKLITVTQTINNTIIKNVNKLLNSFISNSVSIIKSVRHTLTTTVNKVISIVTGKIKYKVITVTVAKTLNLVKSVRKYLTVNEIVLPLLSKGLKHLLVVSITIVANLWHEIVQLFGGLRKFYLLLKDRSKYVSIEKTRVVLKQTRKDTVDKF